MKRSILPFLLFGPFLIAYCQKEDNMLTKRLKIPYDNIVASLSYQGAGSLSVIGIDNRPNILDQTDEKNFVGLIRAPAGVPWRLKTKSGNSFIQDITTSIKLSMEKVGFKVNNYYGIGLQKVDSLTSESSKQSPDRTLLAKVFEFKSYHYDMDMIVHNRTLAYEIELQIFDGSGDSLHSEKFSAIEIELDKKGYGNGKFDEFVPEAVRLELTKILNDEEVKLNLVTINK